MLLYLGVAPFIVFLLFRLFRLLKNYNEARKLNLPLIIIPVSFEDLWWLPLRPLFAWVERLPFGLGSWYLYTELGWPMTDGNRTVSRLGENFVLVAPTHNQIITASPTIADAIYKDVKTWVIPSPFSESFTLFGQNVSSTNGADWQRHRKITAPQDHRTSIQRTKHALCLGRIDIKCRSTSSELRQRRLRTHCCRYSIGLRDRCYECADGGRVRSRHQSIGCPSRSSPHSYGLVGFHSQTRLCKHHLRRPKGARYTSTRNPQTPQAFSLGILNVHGRVCYPANAAA